MAEEKLGDLFEIATQSRTREEYRGEVLRWFEMNLGTDCGSFGTTVQVPELTVRHISAEVGFAYYEESARLGPSLQELFEEIEIAGGVLRPYDAFGRAHRASRPIYGDVFERTGARTMLSVILRSRGERCAALHFYRAGRGARFTDAEESMLRRAWPILALGDALGRASPLLPAPNTPRPRGQIGISRRERQIIGYVAAGLTNPEIGMLCGTSGNTVRNQLAALYRRLQVRSRAELAAMAHACDLLG